LIEPEQKGNPQVNGGLNGLRGLGTVVNLDLFTDTGTSASTGLNETAIRQLLSHATVPTNALVGLNEELLVHVVNFGIVLIKRVSVHGKLNVLDEGLSEEVYISYITSVVISIISSY